jgi:hypothetical protein
LKTETFFWIVIVFVSGDNYFLAMPRTASRACADALKSIGYRQVGHEHWHPQQFKLSDNVVVVVRNHWDWLVSFYKLEPLNSKSFEEWLAIWPYHPMNVAYYSKSGHGREHVARVRYRSAFWHMLPYATRIIRYEFLQEGFRKVFGIGVTKKMGVSDNRKPYQHFYTPATQELVHQLFREEIEELGYEFNGVSDPNLNAMTSLRIVV